MWLFSVGRPHFEELSFSVNLSVSFLTSDLEEFGVGKFSRLFFHLAPDEIHPLALLIPARLLFFIVVCITYRIQACKPILQFSFSMFATSKRGVAPFMRKDFPLAPFSLTTFSFLKKFGSLKNPTVDDPSLMSGQETGPQ